MKKNLLSRRQFGARSVAFGLTLPALSASLALPAAETAKHTVKFPDGTSVPAVGQCAWHLGQGRHKQAV
jgi:hypothetical protein